MRTTLVALAGIALPVIAHATTFPPNCNPQEQGTDATTTFCTTEYYPNPSLATAPNPSAVLDNGLPSAGLTNVSDFIFATAANGGNITSITDVYNTFFSRSTSGDVTNPAYATPNSAPADNNGNYDQYGLFRTYAVGDTNNTLKLTATGGLHFRNICSNNGSTCTQNNIWTAMIRPQFAFHPGQTLKFVYTSPAGCYHWFAMWQFTGEEVSGFNTQNNQLFTGNNGNTWEFDTPDGYSTCYNSPPTLGGNGVVDGFPYEGPNDGASYSIFWPNGTDSSGYKWTYNNVSGEQPWETVPNGELNTASGKHEYVVSWDNTNPTANVISSFLDGHLIHQHTFDFTQDTSNPAGPTGQPLGMQIIISQQAFSSFTGSNIALTQADLKDFVLYEMAEFNGFISQSAALQFAPAPNGCGNGCP